MRTHNICFDREIWKIIPKWSTNTNKFIGIKHSTMLRYIAIKIQNCIEWEQRPDISPMFKSQFNTILRLVWSEHSLSAWRNFGSLVSHWAHSKDWSDWVDAQADLSLHWVHSHFVGFVMLWALNLLASTCMCNIAFYCRWSKQDSIIPN